MAQHLDLAILGTPAQVSFMAYALRQVWLKNSSNSENWRCLAPEPSDHLAPEAILYLLGMDWRAADQQATLRHQLWRQRLHVEGRGYVVLHGNMQQQWQQMTQSLRSLASTVNWSWLPQEPTRQSPRLRPYGCEQCSDPDCERRLFDALRSGRD